MAKKITIPTELGQDMKRNLETAHSESKESKEGKEGIESKESKESKESREGIERKESKEGIERKEGKQRRVEVRSADRGPMMNVHVPLDMKEQLEQVKSARRRNGIKVTTDTIIYEAIVEWLSKNYDKEVGL